LEEKEGPEFSLVKLSDASSNPEAVVVIFADAFIAL
jgi:hypothetical protein